MFGGFIRLALALMVVTVGLTEIAAGNRPMVPQRESKQTPAATAPRKDAAQPPAWIEPPVIFERRVGDLDAMNKTRMAFASYNAGPNRIARLRKKAASQGLDPNQWFGNVELVAAKDVEQENVQYASNIYKYYVAYKLTQAESGTRKRASPRRIRCRHFNAKAQDSDSEITEKGGFTR